ncbi:hypothetical protein CKAH01_16947 [Colletotrichum kahawae]|uniref:Uncharacterized protein n=1 Tax=Colletotrichum kahawae TaxID=34407 RepID=A0AAE0D4R8_COLKA|nr:hypothetical protein CKAH01_16947 [Colletotrichum kahawae]
MLLSLYHCEPETQFLGRLHLPNSRTNGTAPPAEARLRERISA